jgi:hypothetical protein
MRRAITGIPRAGKTTSAGDDAWHTDDLKATHKWGDDSQAIADKLGTHGDGTVEGIAVVRGLRKWLNQHPTGKPCEEVHYHAHAHVPLTKKQAALGKGCDTVFGQIKDELSRRGVNVIIK